MSINSGYIKSLDGIRAVAIILVMTFHAGITHFGWIGVQLFFVLSGFLITGILWKEKTSKSDISFKLKKFWVRRSLRIFPLYMGYLFLLGILFLSLQVPFNFGRQFPYLITYSFNFTRSNAGWAGNAAYTHLWSLCIEEQFYLVFPFIIFFFPKRVIKYIMITVIILAPLIRLMLGSYYLSKGLTPAVAADSIYWNTFSHLDAFFIGGIIPIMNIAERIKRPGRIALVILGMALVAGLYNFKHSNSGAFYLNDLGFNHGLMDNYVYVWQYSLLNLLFAFLIMAAWRASFYNETSILKRFFENRWMINIGKVSYGMYVFHWGIITLIRTYIYTANSIPLKCLLFIPTVILVYFVASISYRFYEVRFIKWKDRFFTDSIKMTNKSSLVELNTLTDEKISG